MKRMVCLLMAAVVLVGSAAAGTYPDKEHEALDFGEMAYEGFDERALTEALDALESLCDAGCTEADLPEARALYETILKENDWLSTQYALANIRYDGGGASQDFAGDLAEVTEQGDRLRDRSYAVLSLLADSPCREILEEDIGEENTDYLVDYEAMSEEEARLRQEETRLVQDYDQTMAAGVELEIDGQIWTMEALDEADLSAVAYRRIGSRLLEAQNQAVGEIYRELIQVRNAIARESDYEDYASYAYEAVYGRDYTPEEAKRLRQAVKRFICPLESLIYERYDFDGLERAFLDPKGDDILDSIQPVLERIHPDLMESFLFMRQYHLCDIGARPEKLPGGYTISLPSYGSAYIFNTPYGTYQDYSDMVHEFGHFNNAFHDPEPDLWTASNIDTAEIHSQALEMLFASAAGEEVFGRWAGDYTVATLYSLLYSIMDGCMYDEFQAEVYANPDYTLEDINRAFKDISEDYGYAYPDGQEESWFWVQITHNFQSPFYYISYAVSALASLDLWLRSLSGWDAAVDTYLSISATSQDIPFCTVLEDHGLADLFDTASIRDLSQALSAFLKEEPVDYPTALPLPAWGRFLAYTAFLVAVSVGGGLCFFVLVTFGMALLVRLRVRRLLRRRPRP